MNFENVEIFRGTMSEFPATHGRFDYVTTRALGRQDELLAWARGVLQPSGRVVLWLGGEDLDKIREKPGWKWSEEIPIPLSARRYTLVGGMEPTE